MEIRLLQYFLTVAREESVTRAAQVLHITQPTLSRQLAQLEEEIGVRLFVRGSRRLTLTEEGLLLRRRAEEIIELVDNTRRELRDELSDGIVNVGSGELSAVQLLAQLFGEFSQKYARIRYNLFTGTADHIKMKMDRGLIDIGLLVEPIDIEKYDFIRLGLQERWVVLMRPDDPLAQKPCVAPADFVGRPVILSQRAGVQNQLANWFGPVFPGLNIRFTSNLSTNAAVMVRAGLGCAFTLEGARPYLDSTALCTRPLSPGLFSTSVLAWKRGQPFSPAAAKFIEHIRQSSLLGPLPK